MRNSWNTSKLEGKKMQQQAQLDEIDACWNLESVEDADDSIPTIRLDS